MRNVNLHVESKQTGRVFDIPATFADAEWSDLHGYLENADRLLEVQLARRGVPSELNIRIRDGHLAEVTAELPSSEQTAALLHRLRPFILGDEPCSFSRTLSVLGKRFQHSYIRNRLKEQRTLFDGLTNQQLSVITSNRVVLNSEKTLSVWLNAYEYHQDPAKRAEIERLHHILPLVSSLPIFMSLLADKVQAIRQIAQLIAVIVGKEESVRMSHRAPN